MKPKLTMSSRNSQLRSATSTPGNFCTMKPKLTMSSRNSQPSGTGTQESVTAQRNWHNLKKRHVSWSHKEARTVELVQQKTCCPLYLARGLRSMDKFISAESTCDNTKTFIEAQLHLYLHYLAHILITLTHSAPSPQTPSPYSSCNVKIHEFHIIWASCNAVWKLNK